MMEDTHLYSKNKLPSVSKLLYLHKQQERDQEKKIYPKVGLCKGSNVGKNAAKQRPTHKSDFKQNYSYKPKRWQCPSVQEKHNLNVCIKEGDRFLRLPPIKNGSKTKTKSNSYTSATNLDKGKNQNKIGNDSLTNLLNSTSYHPGTRSNYINKKQHYKKKSNSNSQIHCNSFHDDSRNTVEKLKRENFTKRLSSVDCSEDRLWTKQRLDWNCTGTDKTADG